MDTIKSIYLDSKMKRIKPELIDGSLELEFNSLSVLFDDKREKC